MPRVDALTQTQTIVEREPEETLGPSAHTHEVDRSQDGKSAEATSPESQSRGSHSTEAKATGEYGAAGQQSHVRDLAKAFTRALPRASNTDPVWDKLPIGYTAAMLVRLQISAQGRIVSALPQSVGDAGSVPRELQRLVRRTVGLLGAGQFALPDGLVGAGTQTLEVLVELLQGKPSGDLLAEPEDSVEVGYTPPSRQRPGRAFFRKHSGRLMVMRVFVEATISVNPAAAGQSAPSP
jgi:hypothetical protein